MRWFALMMSCCLFFGCDAQSKTTYADPEPDGDADASAAEDADAPPAGLEADGTVELGRVAPDFELPDEQGNAQTLAQLNGGEYLVLVFNRGHW